MMTNLFSTFDPSSHLLNLQLNWFASMIGILFIPMMYWISPNRYMMLWNFLMNIITTELKPILNPFNNMNMLIFFSLMLMIMLNNITSLFPYIFSSPSHLTFTLTLALPLWLSFMIFGWKNNYKHMFLHLVPQGTPPILMPFMVCIETISNIIRPLTLAIRLMANMIAGHLLLTLLGNTNKLSSYPIILIILSLQILLLTLESSVAIIQSYVFTILSSLYSKEMMSTYDKSI